MILQCLHCHTNYCDGAETVEEMCRGAFSQGFGSLGFSGHAPLPRGFPGDDWHIRPDALGAYIEEVASAKKRWSGRLEVFCGLEVDFIPGITGPQDECYRDPGLDFLIGSVHYVLPPRGEPFAVDAPPGEVAAGVSQGFEGDGAAFVSSYWDNVMKMIGAGGFDILGHFDLIKKNNSGERYFSPSSPWYRARAEEASRLLSCTGAVAEVNTGGLNRGAISELYPSEEILRLWSSLGIPVMINSDAHKSEHLSGFYGAAAETLQRAGYEAFMVFTGRKEGRWRTERLGESGVGTRDWGLEFQFDSQRDCREIPR